MRNVLFNNHPFGCSLFKRWSFQLTKTDQRKFPFRCSFCLGRLWVACADKKEIDDPWKRRNIYQLYQFFGGSSGYFCGGVIFVGCKNFLNFHEFLLLKAKTIRFHQISWNSPCLLQEYGFVQYFLKQLWHGMWQVTFCLLAKEPALNVWENNLIYFMIYRYNIYR